MSRAYETFFLTFHAANRINVSWNSDCRSKSSYIAEWTWII